MDDGSPTTDTEERMLEPATVIRPDRRLRTDRHTRLLWGGAPPRIMTLTEVGGTAVGSWFSGEPIGAGRAGRRLATRLVGAGLAHIDGSELDRDQVVESGGGTTAVAELVTVVIPVRDDPDGLAATLGCLDSCDGLDQIVIVDDGSRPRIAPTDHRSAGSTPIVVVANHQSLGPAAARNRGLERVATPIVVFIDAGVRFESDDLGRLCHQWPELVIAAAPRVRSLSGAGLVARYERARSPLDMGPDPGIAGPERRVPYVPSTMLAIRTAEAEAVGGFDQNLRFGEDVDLVWRLGSRGWVHYRPEIVVTHPPRRSLAGLIRQRVGYGTAAGALATRHGSSLAPLRAQWSALAAGLVLTGRPAAGVAVMAAGALRLRRQLASVPDRSATAAVLAAEGLAQQVRSVADAVARPWWPAAVAGLLLPRFRRRAILAILCGVGRRLVGRPGDVAPPAVDLAIGIADDMAYGLGVWIGAVRSRTALPLLPRLARRPSDHTRPTKPPDPAMTAPSSVGQPVAGRGRQGRPGPTGL